MRSAPGAAATIDGAMWIEPSARGAQLTQLSLDAHDPVFSIPLKVQADDAQITRSSITAAANSVCVLVGSDHVAKRVLIERNRIHRCGEEGRYRHLLYLVSTRDAVIRWNVLADNAGGWAVQLYPDADRTLVAHNVIDGNEGGVVFGGNGSGETSDGNVVRNNAITFSAPWWNIAGSWSEGPVGHDNRADHNCLYSIGPDGPGGVKPAVGFSAGQNPVLPGSPFINRERGDYRFLPRSPCAVLVGDVRRRARR